MIARQLIKTNVKMSKFNFLVRSEGVVRHRIRFRRRKDSEGMGQDPQRHGIRSG